MTPLDAMKRTVEGIEARRKLRGFYVPEDTTDALNALTNAIAEMEKAESVYQIRPDSENWIAAANHATILAMIALIRQQHEVLVNAYAVGWVKERDDALAAYEQFNSGETK